MYLSEHAQELRTIAIFERAEQLRVDDPSLSETRSEIIAADQIDAEDHESAQAELYDRGESIAESRD